MTLAIILLLSISSITKTAPLAVAHWGQASQQSPPANAASPSNTQDRGGTPQETQTPPSSAPPPATPAAGKSPSSQNQPAAPKRPRHRKKRTVASDCNSTPAPAVNPGASDSAPSTGTPEATGGSTTPVPPPPTQANCPPPKVVVRQGGASEPSIQLAGGAVGDQAARQRETANQILGTTEENLKKIAGHQLTTSQQDIVNQIRQYMAQSKSAVAAGDLERGRTLALKAQLLSEELIKPAK
jgi:hypothetical protein